MSLRPILWLLVALGGMLPRVASAYPTMIRHGYTGCGECHEDPSGGGVLTEYGRGQSAILLSTPWEALADAEGNPTGFKDFLFGAGELPDALALQFEYRGLLIPEPGKVRWVGMQADLRGHLELGPVRAYAGLGGVTEGAERARIVGKDGGMALVSREHWLGVEPVGDLLVRAGSLNLPFGIRTDEHVLYARSLTRTDVNDGQQHGVDAFWAVGDFRLEVMGILGDFQVRPMDYHERGYALTAAWGPESTVDVGVSSLLTTAALDVDTRAPRTRQAHEVFARWAPVGPLVLSTEAGILLDHQEGNAATGTFGYVGADLEPTQGLHLKAMGEWCDDNVSDPAALALRPWGAVNWFPAPHVEVRADAMYGTLYCTPGVAPSLLGLVQAHVYL